MRDSRGGGLLLLQFGSIARGGYGSSQLLGGVGLCHGNNGGVLCQTDLGGDARQRLQRCLDPTNAVITHHAADGEHDGLRGSGNSRLRLRFGGGGSGNTFLWQQGTFHLGDRGNTVKGGKPGLPAAQPQGIADHAHRRETHGGGGKHGVELPVQGGIEYACGDGNANGIIEERPEQVLLDIAQHTAGKLQSGGDIGGIAVHQDDIGGINGNIGAGADGDADIGTNQGGRVIDAVAHHGDDLALFLQGADDRFLLLGQHLRDDPGNADLLGNGFGCTAVITGEQQYRKTHLPQGGNGSGTGFPGRIGDGDEPQGGGADAEIQRGASLGGKLLRRGGKSGDIAAHGGGQAGIAAPDRFAVQFCGKAPSLRRGEIGDGGEGDILFCTVGGDGGS